MPLPYQQNKKHIYAWMKNNKDRKNEIALKSIRRRRMFEGEVKRLCKIIY
jgi:hypothetical protein